MSKSYIYPKSILLILGILLLLNAVVLPFVSVYHAGILFQGLLSAVIIVYALFINHFTRLVHVVAGVFFFLLLLITVSLSVYGNMDNAEYNEDVVIVLGAGLIDGEPGDALSLRLDKAFEYHTKNPDAIIIVCGGHSERQPVSEAFAMERYLIEKGVPPEQIIKEDKSTSTYENLTFAKEILKDHVPDGYASVIITNDFHIFRAVRIAKSAGIHAKQVGASLNWYTIPANYLREILAIGKMVIT